MSQSPGLNHPKILHQMIQTNEFIYCIKVYEELDYQTLVAPNVYQSAFTKEVDSDYDLPLKPGSLLLNKVEESKVSGIMPKGHNSMDEATKEDIGTQELISIIDSVLATQNKGACR